MSIREQLAITAGKSVYWFLHTFRNGGSSFPGQLVERMAPNALSALGKRYDTIIITGTNGKTLTTALTVKALGQGYQNILTNPTGSNMTQGIVAAFLAKPQPARGQKGLAVLEVDEANVERVAIQLHPKMFVLTNIFRDQMDRYGEIYTTYEKILAGIRRCPDATIVANGDAPIFNSKKLPNPKVYYGFNLPDQGDIRADVNTDGVLCPVCDHILHYHFNTYANLGNYFCPNCGFHRPALKYTVNKVDTLLPTESQFDLDGHSATIHIGGMYNIYNTLAAYTVAREFGIAGPAIVNALAGDETVFGRQEVITMGGKTVTIILVKNPVGLNQVLTMIGNDPQSYSLAVLLNSNYADGIDTSWIWDGRFEDLDYPKIPAIITGGHRYKDISLRLQVAGVPAERMQTADNVVDVIPLIKQIPNDRIYVLATYTAMLELRKALADQNYVSQQLVNE
ncbi:MAG: Mur ligase family protein [Schleiferilactobacillus harbinensis]|jgi:UDP-N-acetylmuramoyl-L-alanyl-D-glutamate--2,6-diaminopimelate ligase|nr:Mur ligase family protein [Schleiferilactobacillus harbinensis]